MVARLAAPGATGQPNARLQLLCVALLQPVHTCIGLALHPQAGARTADGWAPPQPTPAVPPDALAPTLLRFLRSRYVLRSSVAAHPAGIDTAVCLQLGGLLDVTRLRVDAGGDVIYTYSCGNAIMALAFGEWPDDSLLTLLKALCASALMINDSATASGLASDLATSAAIRLVRPTLAAAYARQLAAGGWESTMGVRELLCLAQDQRFCAFRSCALAGDLEVNPVE